MIPLLLEYSDQFLFYFVGAEGVINRVVGDQFQMLEGPVACHSADEVVLCCVLATEFARIVRTDANRDTQSKQQRC